VSPDSQYVAFSGKGFGKRTYVKPDVVAQGTQVYGYNPNNPLGLQGFLSGTSFSSPLTAGLIAGMMQRFQQAPPSVWQEALHATSSRSARPDTLYGYGIPSYTRLNDYLTKKYGVSATALVLHPNPVRVNADLQIDLPAGYSSQPVFIYNALGQTIKEASLTKISDNSWQLPLRGLAPGPYFLRIQTSARTYTTRLIIQD
jgi:subtilisin family serine protease